MFKDEKGLGLEILGLGVVGEVMLILFVSVVITASVNTQLLLRSEALGRSGGEEAPIVGLEITVGPGTSILVDGGPATFEQALSRAEKVPEKKIIQVQMHISGDLKLFFDLRVALKKLGRPYIEAAPVGKPAGGKER